MSVLRATEGPGAFARRLKRKWRSVRAMTQETTRNRKPPLVRLAGGEPLPCSVAADLAVVLSPKALSQLFAYVSSTDVEVSCLGVVRRDGPQFVVEEFVLVPQTSSPGHTELDIDGLAALAGKRLNGRSAELRCWLHSHPGMRPFWSATDEACCRRLATDYFVSIVVGRHYAMRCRIDTAVPVPLTLDNVPLWARWPLSEALVRACAQEVAQKVKPTPAPLRPTQAAKPHEPLPAWAFDVRHPR